MKRIYNVVIIDDDQASIDNLVACLNSADINQAAVKNRLNKIIGIMEMDCAFVMRFGNFLRQDNAAG